MELFCIFTSMKVIYTIICKETNKQYIGSALNHVKRKREHFYNLKNNNTRTKNYKMLTINTGKIALILK